MAAFADTLKAVARRLPQARMLVIMGTDGIPVDRYLCAPDAELEAVAAEYTTLLRASLTAAHDTGLGGLREVTVVNEKLTAMLLAITPEYFLFAALAPDARVGEARFVLRMAGYRLQPEFA